MTANTYRFVVTLLALLVVALPTGAQDATPEATGTMLPDVITIESAGLMPEGIAWDADAGTFLVGSLSQGGIYRVADDGNLTLLAENDAMDVSVGIEVDEARNRVLAAAHSGDNSAAALGVFDLETGETLAFVDLTQALEDPSARTFANDVAVDDEGNAYVTDSAAGVIYRVDMDGTPSIFLEDDSFSQGQFALNGIAYNPDGYLLATRTGGLIKIPVDEPESFSEVEIETSLQGGDGITFLDESTLILVTGGQRRVYRIESNDEFATAQVTGEYTTQPQSATTATVRDGEVYFVYAKFSNPMAADYPIERATFEPVAEGTVES